MNPFLKFLMSTNPDTTRRKLDAFDLFIMSVWKPDTELRIEAQESGCFDELMQIREDMLEFLTEKRREIQ